MTVLFVYLAVIAIVTTLAVISTWAAIKLLKDGGLSRRRKWVLTGLLVAGVLLGLYGSVGTVPVSSENRFIGFPIPSVVLVRWRSAERWVSYPVMPGGVFLFAPMNFVFWVGLLVAPVNVVEGWRWWRRRCDK
jgi:hypothetical protein